MRYVRPFVVAVAAALLSTTAVAEEVSIQVENRTSRTVSGFSAFPVGDAGEIIEDNIGGYHHPVPPRGSAVLTLPGICGEILLLNVFEGGAEHRARLNSCHTRRLTLNG